MILPDKEILDCIQDIGIQFTVADLQKPNPMQVQMIFEWFAEVVLNITRETVDPAMRAAAQDVCGDMADAIPADTRNLMGFYVSLRRLLLECGINDFSFADLYRPTHDRFVRILSYLINFVRFRQERMPVIDEHLNKAEEVKARIEQLYAENNAAEARLEELRRNRAALEAEVADKTRRNGELKEQLKELQRAQARAMERLEDTRARKTELASQLEQRTAERIQLRADIAKLRPYTLQSPQALQASLADLNATLAQNRAHIDSLDRRARALQTSADSFGVVASDVAACTRLLDEVAAELAREDEDASRNARQRDALSERGNNVREVERTEAMLRRQLAKWTERTDRLREQSAAKAQEDREKMEGLRAVHKRLTEERSAKNAEMERRRVRIEQTEKKVGFSFLFPFLAALLGALSPISQLSHFPLLTPVN